MHCQRPLDALLPFPARSGGTGFANGGLGWEVAEVSKHPRGANSWELQGRLHPHSRPSTILPLNFTVHTCTTWDPGDEARLGDF